MSKFLVVLSLLFIGCDDTPELVDADGDGFTDDVDCDDGDSAVNPDAAEVCDGIDNDCDESIDDADDGVDTTTGSTFYADVDGDSFGDDAASVDACDQPSGYAALGGDCDDADASVYPSAVEICDGQYNDCDDAQYDASGAPTPESDGDTDGYVVCAYDAATWAGSDAVVGGGDCDDADSTLNPGISEVCDDIDNDCDGLVDDDDDSLDTATGTTFYADNDSDTFGDATSPVNACVLPAGYVIDDLDCDDTDAAINPDAPEIPQDGVDDNCDGYDGCTDLNCDAYTDVYVASLSSGDQHTTFIGNGTSVVADTELTGCPTYDAGSGDFNGDGYIDLVHASYQCSDNNVFYGSAGGHSDLDAAALSVSFALEVQVEDLNGDGYDDAVFGAYDGTGAVFWGSSDGLTTSTELPANDGWDLAIGDADGDGYTDVVFCGYGSYSYLYYGSSTGLSELDYDLIEGPSQSSYVCHMEDLDSDGYPELILGGASSSDSYLYWGTSSGYNSTNRTDLPAVSSTSYGITTGDYNADGYPDLFFSNWSSGASLLYYGSSAGYSSTDSESFSTNQVFRSISADLNSDGYDDLVVPSYYNDGQVYLGSAGGISTTADYFLAATSSYVYNASAADLDGDGYWEILTPNYDSNSVDLYWGSSAGWGSDVDTLSGLTSPFSAPVILGSGESARSQ